MNLKQKLRELLTEGKHADSKFGCVMVFFDYDKKEWEKLTDQIDKEDLYTPDGEKGYGLEDNPHATILYGLHTDIKDSTIKEMCDDISKPNLKLGKVSAFKNDDFDVLKFEVEGDEIHDLNKKFAALPHTNKFKTFEPHCTIGYVKAGTSDKYIKLLNKNSKPKVTSDKIVYSKANDTEINYPFK